MLVPPPNANDIDPGKRPREGSVTTAREREAATISLNEAVLSPESEAPRIGSSWPSGKSLTASASGKAAPIPEVGMAATKARKLDPETVPAHPSRRTTDA